jgi:lipopolysaccharide/colanic/teichoic acid biosynthesis glycosyltransferase
MGFYRRFGKRAVDVFGGATLLILLSPVMATVALLVRLDIGEPVIFRQPRPGLRGRLFTVLKFRSMTDARDAEGGLLPDDSQEAYAAARSGARITRFGRLLRDTSIDELPGLFNVLTGSMSLVGPRPLLKEYVERYTPEQMRRHDVKPGITGWAQIHGRQEMTYEERFALDVWYVDHLSLSLDLRILLLTVGEVLKRTGTHESGYATGTEFMGTSTDAPDGH